MSELREHARSFNYVQANRLFFGFTLLMQVNIVAICFLVFAGRTG